MDEGKKIRTYCKRIPGVRLKFILFNNGLYRESPATCKPRYARRSASVTRVQPARVQQPRNAFI